jgi:site-specific recombinase XerD
VALDNPRRNSRQQPVGGRSLASRRRLAHQHGGWLGRAPCPRLPPRGCGLILPATIARAGERASRRFLEYFAAEVRNPHTRRAYAAAAERFLGWCDARGLALEQLEPVLVAAYVEELGRELGPASVKQHLAALRRLFDYLVVGQVLPANPAAAVRGPRLVIRTGKTPVLEPEEVRALLASIAGEDLGAVRDRAFSPSCSTASPASAPSSASASGTTSVSVGGRTYGSARRAASIAASRSTAGPRRTLDAYLAAAGEQPPDAPLFQAIAGRTGRLTGEPLSARSALRVVKRRAAVAGIGRDLGCHSCHATGITAYLFNGGTLERAAAIAGHASTRTTQLYDRRRELVEPEEIERLTAARCSSESCGAHRPAAPATRIRPATAEPAASAAAVRIDPAALGRLHHRGRAARRRGRALRAVWVSPAALSRPEGGQALPELAQQAGCCGGLGPARCPLGHPSGA